MMSAVTSAVMTPVRSSPLGESALRLRHYKDGINQGEVARDILAEDLRPNDHVKVICGEFSPNTYKFVQKVLDQGAIVDIISGNDTRTPHTEIDELLKNYSGKINYFKLGFRPKFHGMLIGKNIFLEDRHLDNKKYKTCIAVRNAWDDTLTKFNKIFDQYLSKAEKV